MMLFTVTVYTIIVSTLCSGAEVVPGSPGSGPVFLQELSCSDNDTHILNCNRYVPSHSLIIIFSSVNS